MTTEDYVPLYEPVPCGRGHIACCRICTACPRSLGSHAETHLREFGAILVQVRHKWFLAKSALGLVGRFL